MLNKVLRVLMYGTVFLLPVFFLPFTFEVLEFNKLYLSFFLVWLSALVWLLKMIVKDKKVSIRYSIIDFAVLGFMAIAIISSVFSVGKTFSLFGYYGRFSTGLVSLLTFGAFYFLIVNNLGIKSKDSKIENKKTGVITINGIIKTLLWSGGLVMSFAYFALFGIWAKLATIKSLEPLVGNIALRISPVGGTLEALAMFLVVLLSLAVLMVLGTSAPFANVSKRKNRRNIFLGIFIFFAFILLIIADFTPAWIILVLNLLFLVIFILRKRTLKKEVHRLILPIALIIISSLFLVLNFKMMATTFPNFVLNKSQGFASERIMTQGESWSVAGKTAISGVKEGLVGSGLGTFYYDVSKFRPATLNNGGFWAISFERSGNVFSEILATTGFLGLLAFLAIIGFFFWKILVSREEFGFTFAKKKTKKLDSGSQLLLLVFASLLLIQFFYYQTLTLSFLFWLFLALIISWFSLKTEEGDKTFIRNKEFKLRDFVEIALVLETFCIILFLVFIVVSFFGLKVYLADAKYVKALNEPDINKKGEILQQAIKLNPREARYQMVFSKVFLVKAQQALTETESGGSQEDVMKNLETSRLFANNAIAIAPNDINSWQNLTDLYQTIAAMSQDKNQFINLAIESLDKESELAPKNPRIYTDKGNLYLLVGKKEEAKIEFEKALAQKENYAPGNISWALMLEEEGNKEEAIAKLEWFLSKEVNNPEALFHLGRLYYNDNQTDKAINAFIGALILNPRYSNARYSLAVAYEKQGKIDEALAQLEIVTVANPTNQEVKDRIKRLKAGTSEPKEEIELPEEEEEGVLEEIK